MENDKIALPPKAIFLAVFCNLLFGSAVPAVKLGYAGFNISDDLFSKILFAGMRFFFAGALVYMVVCCLNRRVLIPSRGNGFNVFAVGIVYTFLQHLFNYLGLANTEGATASLLTASSAFISVIFAHIFYKNDKINLQKLLGCIIGFVGVALVCYKGGLGNVSFFGEGFIFLSSVLFIIGSMLNKRAAARDDSFLVTALNLMTGGGLMIIVGLMGYSGGMTFSITGLFALLYLILVSSLGTSLWCSLIRKYPIGKLGVYNLIIPVAGMIFSGILLGENILTERLIFSVLLITAGIIAVNYKHTVHKTHHNTENQ